MAIQNGNSPHILNTSATLMGFCFVVLTSSRINNWAAGSKIDETTAIAIVIFMASCIVSFLSIRSTSRRGAYFEKVAEYIFLAGLLIVFLLTILIAFNVIR